MSPPRLWPAPYSARCSLRRFVSESTPWVHIDLYAWNSKDRPGRSIGAEAQGLRGVYRYLVQRYGTA